MKDEPSVEKLKGAKLWITAGPREKFTASEVTEHFVMLGEGFGKQEEGIKACYVSFPVPLILLFFFSPQLEVLKHYLDGGGNMLVMLGEGGETKYDTNINFLLEEFGILVNNGGY